MAIGFLPVNAWRDCILNGACMAVTDQSNE